MIKLFMHDTIESVITSSPVISHGVMALFGAISHAIRAHRNGQSKGIVDFFLLTVMSSFSGVIFGLVAANTFENQYLTLASAGAGGLLGVDAITVVAYRIRDSLALTFNIKK